MCVYLNADQMHYMMLFELALYLRYIDEKNVIF